MSGGRKKSLGQAIDDVVATLEQLDEGARETAIRAACDYLGIDTPSSAAPLPISTERDVDANGRRGIATPVREKPAADIRTLKEQKQPATAQEMACLVAYYLESLAGPDERKREIGPADLEKYFKQASFRLPKRIPQVLIDAKSAGYFDSTSRGKYKLNPVGHNLVVHNLPKGKK